MKNILLVDDEKDMGQIVSRLLTGDGYGIEHVCTGMEALEKIEKTSPDLVLLDINLPDMDGMEILREVNGASKRVPVVMITAYGRIETAVQAIKSGAIDYIEKPFDLKGFRGRIWDILSSMGESQNEDCGTVGSSLQIKRALSLINKFALSDITILLQGESGTGKELFAKAVHQKSKRKNSPFVPLDCAALSESLVESELFGHEKGAFTGAVEKKIGKIERANGGTLFIDEVQNLSPSIQAKLLRVIQERQIERVGGGNPVKADIRIVAASNVNLKEAVDKGRFRQDLYYRISQVAVNIPPLREREGDVDVLVHHFLAAYSREFGRPCNIAEEALMCLRSHNWPGNVRELENIVKSTAILSDGDIQTRNLPEYLKACPLPFPARQAEGHGGADLLKIDEAVEKGLIEGSLDLKALIRHWSDSLEESVILKVMERSMLNMNMVAEFLNIDPKTLRSKIRHIRLARTKNTFLDSVDRAEQSFSDATVPHARPVVNSLPASLREQIP